MWGERSIEFLRANLDFDRSGLGVASFRLCERVDFAIRDFSIW